MLSSAVLSAVFRSVGGEEERKKEEWLSESKSSFDLPRFFTCQAVQYAVRLERSSIISYRVVARFLKGNIWDGQNLNHFQKCSRFVLRFVDCEALS